jgi:hypothetical protein
LVSTWFQKGCRIIVFYYSAKSLLSTIIFVKTVMNHLAVANKLHSNKEVFRHLFGGVRSEQYLWKPQADKWCLLEILCHLYDEEREDFRARVRSVLKDPQQPLAPIDPQGWVAARNYMGQHYDEKLGQFLAEREASVAFLTSLATPDWNNTYQHPKLGAMPASLFLHNWLAHDYLHIRQVTATKYLYLKANSADSLSYAGEW